MTDRKRPPISKFGPLSVPPQQTVALDNGVTVHFVNNGDQPIVRTSVMWNRGDAESTPHQAAIFVPQMLREGTENMSGAEIAEYVDFEGAWLRSNPTRHVTGIDALSLQDKATDMIGLLSDIIHRPTFPANAFEALRQKAAKNLELKMSRVSYVSQSALEYHLAGKSHPYIQQPTVDEINSITLDDVKRTFADGINGATVHIFAAGLISDDIRRAVLDFARALRPAGDHYTPATIVPLMPGEPCRRDIAMPDAIQSSISMGKPAIPRTHPDYIPLRIAVMALGGYFGSRLMTNIREDKGLTYNIAAELQGTHEGGNIVINAQCDPSYVAQVIDETFAEISRLATEPMPREELDALVQYLSSNLAATLDSPLSIADHYLNQLLVGTPADYFARQFEVLAAITPATICEMTRRYILGTDFSIFVAGPRQ